MVSYQTCAAERCGTHAADEVPKDILLVMHIVLDSVVEKYKNVAVRVWAVGILQLRIPVIFFVLLAVIF